MQVLPGAAAPPPATPTAQAVPVAERATPDEPARRVTGNREGRESSLGQQPRLPAAATRGRLLDLFV